MAGNILGLGISGLKAAQVGLAVTGNNIANAATPGFTRQQAIQAPAKEQNFGFGFVGQGTNVVEVRRFYDELLSNQVNAAETSNAEVTTYSDLLSSIDNIIGDGVSGLSPALADFFNSISLVASNPSDSASRQSFVSAAGSLETRFNDLAETLARGQETVNSQIQGSVQTINSYATQIAALNEKIDKATSASGKAPNSLMDQRDYLVTELSKQVKTTVVKQNNTANSFSATYNVFIGNGQPLVVSDKAYSLVAVQSASDGTKIDVAYVGTNGKAIPIGEQSIAGGALGGLLDFRAKSLDAIQNQIGQIGIVLSDTYNKQNRLGTDVAGAPGGDLFKVAEPFVFQNTNNTGNGEITAAIVDSSQLPSSNYELKYDGVQYTIKRLSDGFQQSFTTLPQSLNGIDFNLASGTVQSGDSFLIKPTINGALNFKSEITNGSKLAAGASPFVGPGDNRNALELAKLNTKLTIDNGKSSYSSAYNSVVSTVGVKASELKLAAKAEAGFLNQAFQSQQAVSGVNLDEEAANLLRYQQAYQASAKMIQVVSELFDTLLSLR